MLNQERREENLSLIKNEQGETVGVRITNPQVFGFKGSEEIAKRQMTTEGKVISLKVAREVILLSQEAASEARKSPHKKRRKAIRLIAAAMYKAEEVTIYTSEIKQRRREREKTDSIPSTFTIRKPTARELIQIIQDWRENNGKGVTLAACGIRGERPCVTLTPKNQKKILAEVKALDAFAKISIEVIVHKSA